jgi:hypothetical protein
LRRTLSKVKRATKKPLDHPEMIEGPSDPCFGKQQLLALGIEPSLARL